MTEQSMRYAGLLEELNGWIQVAQIHLVTLLTKVGRERRSGLRP